MSNSKSDNVWNHKPRWCQPWSILLTGITLIAGCWFLTQRLWLTLLLSIPILLWWFVFLILYPRTLQQQLNTERIGESID
ncbi:MAG: DUF6737 family protein [Microcystis sp.]|jgi:hypothetical protein|uniref:DUF6737 domain-containing protein n=8 Tax=Microcystis TaxID=1125 RepID=A0A841V5L8_MICAE|nr:MULTISPECIES: DUF6737 family protein [Microcystis]MCA2537990.1 hypothetical protein [Microcystis sp. M54BS1]MCA2594305.1 hypothetical protein [Microcystis sp. M38BS1]MCA2612568.1 hypothetical protein [Microcystis sp. M27BS1]NCR55822.1 hypothetical protein [Microcystis aeruginosa L211-07]NCS28166.1 hypothetical protein [Microcystis aeruginosa F13-15]TRT85059.1 MAG: hypothetical protein EWV82_07515 [Microcystis aeruginosa Ma_AC_P_19900807_S299]TRU04699.1 MAG: hypothetical protein EWV61_0622